MAGGALIGSSVDIRRTCKGCACLNNRSLKGYGLNQFARLLINLPLDPLQFLRLLFLQSVPSRLKRHTMPSTIDAAEAIGSG